MNLLFITADAPSKAMKAAFEPELKDGHVIDHCPTAKEADALMAQKKVDAIIVNANLNHRTLIEVVGLLEDFEEVTIIYITIDGSGINGYGYQPSAAELKDILTAYAANKRSRAAS